jgi:hypothetical protein
MLSSREANPKAAAKRQRMSNWQHVKAGFGDECNIIGLRSDASFSLLLVLHVFLNAGTLVAIRSQGLFLASGALCLIYA